MTKHQRIISVDPDIRGIVRIFLENYGRILRDLKDFFKELGDREAIRQLTAMVQALYDITTKEEVDIFPIHQGVRLLGRIEWDQNGIMVDSREKAIKRNAIKRYSDRE